MQKMCDLQQTLALGEMGINILVDLRSTSMIKENNFEV